MHLCECAAGIASDPGIFNTKEKGDRRQDYRKNERIIKQGCAIVLKQGPKVASRLRNQVEAIEDRKAGGWRQ